MRGRERERGETRRKGCQNSYNKATLLIPHKTGRCGITHSITEGPVPYVFSVDYIPD